MHKLINIIAYALKMRWFTLLPVFIVTLFWLCNVASHGSLLTDIFTKFGFVNGWDKNYNVYVGVATLLVTLAVWVGEVYNGWLDDLPKKLTVKFNFEGRVVMECRRADLAGVGDSRALAQQIGKQMACGQELHFVAPAIEQTGGEVYYDASIKHYRHYYISITLLDILPYKQPEFRGGRSQDNLYFKEEIAPKIANKTHYLSWEHPFGPLPVCKQYPSSV